MQRFHGANQWLDGGDDVLEDQAGEAPPVGVAVAFAMDDSHLFDEGALATLTSPCDAQRRIRLCSQSTEINGLK